MFYQKDTLLLILGLYEAIQGRLLNNFSANLIFSAIFSYKVM